MEERRYDTFTFLQMQTRSASTAINLLSNCDQEFADEADEPPEQDNPQDFVPHSFHAVSLLDGEFTKHAIRHPAQTESLLTRALTSPELGPVDRSSHGRELQRGFSISSTWSNASAASTAELTSDAGLTTPSRANTPSPPPPMFLGGFSNMLTGVKMPSKEETKRVEILSSDKDDVVEGLGRRRCITFACGDKNTVKREPEIRPVSPSPPKQATETTDCLPPKKTCSLRFACTQREDTKKTESLCQRTPARSASKQLEENITKELATAASEPLTVQNSDVKTSIRLPPPRKFYDSDDSSDDWANQPIDRTRLLKVDDVLKKEMDIRKLGQEAEEEVLEEEADEDAGDDGSERDEDEDEEDGEDEDEDEDEDQDEEDGFSGNETDNEEGFASDDDSEDDFFGIGLPRPIPGLERPLCYRMNSDSSIESFKHRKPLPRSVTPELPDSTDFVCGTLDEDRPLEQAYLSAMEERRRSKHKVTPQDIDPSFPTSDSDDSVHNGKSTAKRKSSKSGRLDGDRTRGPNRNMKKPRSPSPRGRVHSPAPVRRKTFSPPPTARPISPRRGRAASPAPVRPTRKDFESGQPVVRTKSLPRTRNARLQSAATSPKTRPVVIRRGAMDIVKGLEKKRERRKARRARAEEGSWRKVGEGVEKMRVLGLEISGKNKGKPAQWVLSV